MSRRLTSAAGVAAAALGTAAASAMLALAAAPVWAQPSQPDEAGEEPSVLEEEEGGAGDAASADPFGATPADATPAAEPAAASAGVQEDAAPDGQGEGRWTDQGLGVSLGVAFGGAGITPGGVRVTGTYLYRLSARDWFDGAAAFTIGSGTAECFRDRLGDRVCEHGATDGFAVDFVGAVRRSFAPQKSVTPFARVGAALRFVRFSGDQLAGLAVPLIGGGGVTIELAPSARLVGAAQLEIGGGLFSRGLGTAPQLGLSMGIGVELAMR
jgi:hypothetical protein